MNMNNNGAYSSLPTPSASSAENTPFLASTQRAQPQLRGAGGQPPLPSQQVNQLVFNRHPQAYPSPATTTSGPSLDALNAMANENARFGGRPPGMPAQTWNTGFPPLPPIPQVPQGPYRWPAYGHHLSAQNYYGGYHGPPAQGAAPYHGAQMHPPAARAVQVPHLQQQQVLPNAAPPPPASQNYYGGYHGAQAQGAAPYHGAQMHPPAARAVQVPRLQQQQVLPNAALPPPATQNYYGGYHGAQAQGAAPYQGAQMRAPAARAVQVPHLQQQQVLPNAVPPPPATQEHAPRIPGYVNPRVPSLGQGVQQAPPVQWPPPAPFAGPPVQFQPPEQVMPQVPSAGPVEGSSTRGSKRKAVDNDNTTQSKQKRHRPQDDPDFELAPPSEDGKLRWKCLKQACAHVKPMLENSVHKHVTATVSHQKDSEQSLPVNVCPGCGFSFKRPDALKRHGPTDQCTRNKAKALQNAQAGSQALGNSTSAAGPSSGGSASSTVIQNPLLLPVATPSVVQTTGNSTFGAAAPVVMPQQQFTFEARPPGLVTWQFGAQAPRTEPRSMGHHVPSLPVLPQTIPSLPKTQATRTESKSMMHHVPSLAVLPQTIPSLPLTQAPIIPTSVQQQPAVTRPLQAIQGHSSSSNQISTPLPSTSVQPSSLPVIAGDFTLSIFKKAAAPSSPSPPEDVNDSSEGLFSAPASPSPPEDVNDPFEGLFSAPASPSPPEDVNDPFEGLFSAPTSPSPPKDVNDPFEGLFSTPSSSSPSPPKDLNDPSEGLFSAKSSPSPPEDVNDPSTSIFSAPSSPILSEDALFDLYLFSAPPSPS
ncbi:hypothetical protein F4604DRAFT_1673301 [Suillus subluteus]|nr:hypothetical protein F4604DRAFT_1673301 [Suillus subluteus]